MKKIKEILYGPWYWRYLIPVYAILFCFGLAIGAGLASVA